MLRDTPYIDNSHIGQDWTTKWRYQVVDAFSGPGGVGLALSKHPAPLDPWTFLGIDIVDYSDTYPGTFKQADLLSDPNPTELTPEDSAFAGHESLTADVVWCSFPCTAYSTLTRLNYSDAEDPTQAALDDNPRVSEELREFLLDIAPHYVIENVPRATKVGDLKANTRANGLAFGLPIDQERHFETTFPCPEAYVSGNPDVTLATSGDQSIDDLAEAKDVPKSWGKQSVRSALPWQYVYWVLHHCPSVPAPCPKRINSPLFHQMNTNLGLKQNRGQHGQKSN